MKKICIALVFALSITTVEAIAQNLLKRIGNAVENEVTKVVKQNTEANSKTQQVKKQPAQQEKATESNPAAQSNGEKKYVKNIDLYYKIGKVAQSGYKLYYDGSNYYVEVNGKQTHMTPCDGEFMERKYYFFVVNYGIELYVNENLPGAVGKRVVKTGPGKHTNKNDSGVDPIRIALHYLKVVYFCDQ